MRAVLDTVAFVRALINPKRRWGRLLFDLSDRYVIVLSPDIIKEIVSVLYRPALRKRFPRMGEPPQLDRVLRLFEQAEIVEPVEEVAVCHDPADDKFFACAVAGQVDYIVTEDKDILDVGQHRAVRPITTAEFVDRLEQG